MIQRFLYGVSYDQCLHNFRSHVYNVHCKNIYIIHLALESEVVNLMEPSIYFASAYCTGSYFGGVLLCYFVVEQQL